MSDTYTIPEMELTPEADGSVRITMADSGVYVQCSRGEARVLLAWLGLSVPEWMLAEREKS